MPAPPGAGVTHTSDEESLIYKGKKTAILVAKRKLRPDTCTNY